MHFLNFHLLFIHHLKSSRLSFHAKALHGICASYEAYSHSMCVASQHFSLALVSNFCILCIFIAQYPATSTFARTHSTLTQAQSNQADTHWANTTITVPGTSLVAAITNSCLTAWLKMQPQSQPQPQPPPQPITRQSVRLNLKPSPYPNLDPVKLLLWLLLYLMLAFAAYRLKGVHPWRRRQAGWWSGSQCRACVPGQARPGQHPVSDQDAGRGTLAPLASTRTRTRAGQWRPVSLRFRLSWQFIQFFHRARCL